MVYKCRTITKALSLSFYLLDAPTAYSCRDYVSFFLIIYLSCVQFSRRRRVSPALYDSMLYNCAYIIYIFSRSIIISLRSFVFLLSIFSFTRAISLAFSSERKSS